MKTYEQTYQLVKPDKIYHRLCQALAFLGQNRPPTDQEMHQEINLKMQSLFQSGKLCEYSDYNCFPGYTPWPTLPDGLPLYNDLSSYNLLNQPVGYRPPRDQAEQAHAIAQRNQYLYELKQQGWVLHPNDEFRLLSLQQKTYDDDIHPKLLIAIAEKSDSRSEWRLYLGITFQTYKNWVKRYERFRLAAEQAEQLLTHRLVSIMMQRLQQPDSKPEAILKWMHNYCRNDPEIGLVLTEEMTKAFSYMDKDWNVALSPPAQRGK